MFCFETVLIKRLLERPKLEHYNYRNTFIPLDYGKIAQMRSRVVKAYTSKLNSCLQKLQQESGMIL